MGQKIGEGQYFYVNVYLTGPAINYPVIIPYQVSGATTYGSDHTISESGNFVIDRGEMASLRFSTLKDDLAEGAETITFTIGEPINSSLGTIIKHTVVLSEDIPPPSLNFALTQATNSTRIIQRNLGPVTVKVFPSVNGEPSIPNLPAIYNYQWSADQSGIVMAENNGCQSLSFDPASLSTAAIQVSVKVSRADDPSIQSQGNLILTVDDEAASLLATDIDSDGDGIADAYEGMKDTDFDGVPNYKDAIPYLNLLQAEHSSLSSPAFQNKASLPMNNGIFSWLASNKPQSNIIGPNLLKSNTPFNHIPYLLHGEPGTALRLGGYAQQTQHYSARILAADLPADHPLKQTGTQGMLNEIFDVEIIGHLDQSTYLVLPLSVNLKNLSDLKLYDTGQKIWRDFTLNETNALSFYSKGKNALSLCPVPGNTAYVPELSAENQCVQLYIQDGGPNDADGYRNGITWVTLGIFNSSSASNNSGEPSPKPSPNQIPQKNKNGGGAITIEFLLGFLLLGSILINFYKKIPRPFC